MPHENFLAGSYYGKFFARNLHLTLLRRKPVEWKALQSRSRPGAPYIPSAPTPVKPSTSAEEEKDKKKEKKRKREDAIDEIFESQAGGGNRKMKAPKEVSQAESSAPTSAATGPSSKAKAVKLVEGDDALASVLGAIRDVPKGTALKEGKRHKKSNS